VCGTFGALSGGLEVKIVFTILKMLSPFPLVLLRVYHGVFQRLMPVMWEQIEWRKQKHLEIF
jgi:hypothetical protein